MHLKSVKDIKDLAGKRVLLRADFDVPVRFGRVTDETRIRKVIPTIQYLLKKQAIVEIVAHRGRLEDKTASELTLAPVARCLAKLLKKEVKFLKPRWNEPRPFATQLKVIGVGAVLVKKSLYSELMKLKGGEVLIFENIRYDRREEKNSEKLAEQLAAIADLYVNEAFATAHRAHSSMLAITKFLPAFAGFNLEMEIKNLSQLLKKTKRPLVYIVGGIKISTKLGVIKKFLRAADEVLVGGALANTVLRAQGVAVGKSIIEPEMVETVKKLKLTDTKLHLPLDAVVSTKLEKSAKARTTAIGKVKAKELILDIGPDTTDLFLKIISRAKTIVWNGPMGAFEWPKFAKSTKLLTEAVLNSKAKVFIGGGDTIAAVNKFSKKPVAAYRNVYISAGGGAMLKFLEEGSLIALKPLMK